MNNKEYMFYINWKDRNNNSWQVGYLGEIEEEYYLLIKEEKRAPKAYSSGFIGIPGFLEGRVYRSPELFDFFKNRVLDKKSDKPLSELFKTKGVSNIDSFSVEIVPEELVHKKQEDLKLLYQMQQRLNLIRSSRNKVAKREKGKKDNKVELVHG